MEYHHAAPFTSSGFHPQHYHQYDTMQPRYASRNNYYDQTAPHSAANYQRTAVGTAYTGGRYVDDRSGPYTGLSWQDFYPSNPGQGNYVGPVFSNMGAAAAAAGTATGAYSAFRYRTDPPSRG